MNTFLQFLSANWSGFTDLVGFFVLYLMIKQQGYKMDLGFKEVRSEISQLRTELKAEMNEGFLKIRHRLKVHDREIKHLKKKKSRP